MLAPCRTERWESLNVSVHSGNTRVRAWHRPTTTFAPAGELHSGAASSRVAFSSCLRTRMSSLEYIATARTVIFAHKTARVAMPWWVRRGERTGLTLTSAKMVRFMNDAERQVASRTKSSALTCMGTTSVGSRHASEARRPGAFSGTRRLASGEGGAQACLPRRGKDQQESPAYESLVGIDRRAGIRGENDTRPSDCTRHRKRTSSTSFRRCACSAPRSTREAPPQYD